MSPTARTVPTELERLELILSDARTALALRRRLDPADLVDALERALRLARGEEWRDWQDLKGHLDAAEEEAHSCARAADDVVTHCQRLRREAGL